MSLDSFKKYQLPKLKKKFDIVEFNTGSFRFKKGDLTVDFFPKRGKFFNHNTGERGVTQDIKGYMNNHKGKKVINEQIETKKIDPPFDPNDKWIKFIIFNYKKAQKEALEAWGDDLKDIYKRLELIKAQYIRYNNLLKREEQERRTLIF